MGDSGPGARTTPLTVCGSTGGALPAPSPARTGTGGSSAELFSSYHAKIRRFILTMVGDLDEADDLTQEVFLQAHRRLGSLRDADAVGSWLYRIATHVCYDRFRKWSRQPRPYRLESTDAADAVPLAGGGDEPSLGRVIEQAEMSACVGRYLDELRDDYRTVILLHDVEAVTNIDIAEMLGCSLDAVKIRLHRARRKLADALAAHCEFSRDEQGVFVCDPITSPTPTPVHDPVSLQPPSSS